MDFAKTDKTTSSADEEETHTRPEADGVENRNPAVVTDTLGNHSISSSDFLIITSSSALNNNDENTSTSESSHHEARQEIKADTDTHDVVMTSSSSPPQSPPPPPPMEASNELLYPSLSDDTTTATTHQSLEARVEELELKLAVVARLLQQQRSRPRTPDETPPRHPPSRFTPHLESPAPGMSASSKRKQCFVNPGVDLMPHPPTTTTPLTPSLPENEEKEEEKKQDEFCSAHSKSAFEPGTALLDTKPQPIDVSQRNLSYTLLFDGDAEAYNRTKTPPTCTAVNRKERKWTLQPRLLQFPEPSEVAPTIRTKWLDFLNSSFSDGNSDVDKQMQEFIRVPGALEGLLFYGFYVCVDSYLSIVIVLPVRFLWSCVLLCSTAVDKARLTTRIPTQLRFHRRHLYQLIQVMILFLIYRYVLSPISIGKLYHWIRGQAMIKLYVIIAMVEIFDRLFSSLGQDCLDSLYWNTVHTPGSTRFVISAVVVLVYAALHTLILFVHVATLNVAMNSADQALLTLLISGNFAEIKSTVFKKYNKAALFKITTSDICERFKLSLFLGLVLLLNVSQGMDYSQLLGYIRICGWVMLAEVVADWIKHAFITKFNFIASNVYHEYSLLLAGDVTGIGHEGFNLDHSHAVVKRLGFAQIPLVAVMMRLLKEVSKYRHNTWRVMLVLWLFLALAKWGLQTSLHWHSIRRLQAVPDIQQPQSAKKKGV